MPVPDGGKFICVGKKCEVVKRILLKWGWTENNDPNSTDFDLKWSTARSGVDSLILPTTQLVNHFKGSGCLHNKAAMAESLNQCPSCSQVFYPRQYDLQSSVQVRQFLEDYVITQAELRLKNEPDHAVAARILQRASDKLGPLIRCAHEWRALTGSESQLPELLAASESMRPFARAYSQSYSNESCPVCTGAELVCGVASTSASSSSQISLTKKCKEQASLDGPANVWVVKNPCLSRARGICVLTGLRNILGESEKAYMKDNPRGHSVIQKYIERPLRLRRGGHEAKTDLRLWVLVLSFNPLIAFVYPDVYFRVATSDFTLEPMELGRKKVYDQMGHVTNNRSEDNRVSSAKLFKELGPEKAELWERRTWPLMLDAVRATLLANQGKVLSAAQEFMNHQTGKGVSGPNAFELFGFDFAVDDDLRPWMLEANVSPDMLMELSPDIKDLQDWSETATEGLLGIVLAYRAKTLNIPKISELKAWESKAGRARSSVSRIQLESDGSSHAVDQTVANQLCDKPERLFVDSCAHESHLCYGSIVSQIPECLIPGLDLGPPCNGWLLILREKGLEDSKIRSSWMQNLSAGFFLEGREECNRMQVLRDILLPVPRRWQVPEPPSPPSQLPQRSSRKHRSSTKLPSLVNQRSHSKPLKDSGIIYPHCVHYDAYIEPEETVVCLTASGRSTKPSARLKQTDTLRSTHSVEKEIKQHDEPEIYRAPERPTGQQIFQRRMQTLRWSNITQLPGVCQALQQLSQPHERNKGTSTSRICGEFLQHEINTMIKCTEARNENRAESADRLPLKAGSTWTKLTKIQDTCSFLSPVPR